MTATCLTSAKSAACCICQSIDGANPAGAGDQPVLWENANKQEHYWVLATFRSDYEYEIKYECDCWISNQWRFQSSYSLVFFTSREGSSRNEMGTWRDNVRPANWNWKLVLQPLHGVIDWQPIKTTNSRFSNGHCWLVNSKHMAWKFQDSGVHCKVAHTDNPASTIYWLCFQ